MLRYCFIVGFTAAADAKLLSYKEESKISRLEEGADLFFMVTDGVFTVPNRRRLRAEYGR